MNDYPRKNKCEKCGLFVGEGRACLCEIDPRDVALAASGLAPAPETSALNVQVGGAHYKHLAIQPAEYCHANRIGKLEGDVIAYVTRYRDKNGIEDLQKARHTIDLIIELEKIYHG